MTDINPKLTDSEKELLEMFEVFSKALKALCAAVAGSNLHGFADRVECRSLLTEEVPKLLNELAQQMRESACPF